MNQTINPSTMTPITNQPLGVIESASASAAALARASVEARYIMATRNPRNANMVRLKVLDACKRTSFAETARYAKPIGGSKVEGPSIRFAEEVARCMGNIQIESAIVHEDQKQRIVRVTVTDLEANLTYPTDVLVEKQVERSRAKEGQTILGKRINSRGYEVFIVEASEDEMLVKAAALTSKAVRTAVLRLLPGDILDEAMEQVIQTLRKQDEQDPAAARKKLCDAFHTMGVSPENLVEYLGHAIEQSTPSELQDLRQVYAALREGEATWAKVMETRSGKDEKKSETKDSAELPKRSRAEALKGNLKASSVEPPPPPVEPPPPPPSLDDAGWPE